MTVKGEVILLSALKECVAHPSGMTSGGHNAVFPAESSDDVEPGSPVVEVPKKIPSAPDVPYDAVDKVKVGNVNVKVAP